MGEIVLTWAEVSAIVAAILGGLSLIKILKSSSSRDENSNSISSNIVSLEKELNNVRTKITEIEGKLEGKTIQIMRIDDDISDLKNSIDKMYTKLEKMTELMIKHVSYSNRRYQDEDE